MEVSDFFEYMKYLSFSQFAEFSSDKKRHGRRSSDKYKNLNNFDYLTIVHIFINHTLIGKEHDFDFVSLAAKSQFHTYFFVFIRICVYQVVKKKS